MSYDLARAAWRAHLPNGSDKLVLLALADFANAQGDAWPKIETLAAKCSRSEQTVREALQRLARAGHVTRTPVEGRPSIYRVHPLTPPEIQQGSENHMGSEDSKGSEDREGSEDHHPTPPGYREGTPTEIHEGPLMISGPRTITNQQGNQSVNRKARARAAEFTIPDWIPVDEWNGWLSMRERSKAPATGRAMELAIATLEKLRAAGHDPAAVLDQSTLNGWKGLFPLKEQRGSRADEIDRAAADLGFGRSRGARPDPALDLLRASRAAEAAEAADPFGGSGAGPTMRAAIAYVRDGEAP